MKPRFLNDLHVAHGRWPMVRLLAPLHFQDAQGYVWRVPTGFESDLASVPFGLRWLVPRAGKHNRAAVLHDYLFTLRRQGRTRLSRNQTDNLMLQAMRADRVSHARRGLIRAGLFVGSWIPWIAARPKPKRP